MGNQLNCRPSNASKTVKNSQIRQSTRKNKLEQELLIQQHALAFLLHQQQSSNMRLDRSISQKNSNQRHDQKGFPRSKSVRNDASPQNMAVATFSNSKQIHFVLIHGGGTGAWCWYKSKALLEQAGFVATAIDLLGSGIESTDPNTILGLAQFTEPLLRFLGKLEDGETVILVGHDIGGACISYAMEHFPQKISKAIFVAATMVASGQSAFDVFASEVISSDNLLPKAQQFVYANGTSSPPTAMKLDNSLVKDIFFNQCPAKDIVLATVAMRPIPFAPIVEKLNLTSDKYGSVRRFFIVTMDDLALSPIVQERLISKNPPDRFFKVKSDHCPFFSKPQSLHKVLIDIAHEVS